MFLIEPFQYGSHNRFPEKFRFVFNPVAVTINAQRSHFPVIEHQGKFFGSS